MPEELPIDQEIEAAKFNAEQRLKELGFDFPVEYAREIPEEYSGNQEKVEANIFWLRFPPNEEFGTDSIEGKLYAPQDPNGEAIIFTSGYPGGKTGRFERMYAAEIAKAGYTLVTLRHNSTGLATEGDHAQNVINCPERQLDAQKEGQTHLGPKRENGYTWTDMIDGPIPAFMAVAPKFERIHMIGHSFGGAANLFSLSEIDKKHPELTSKVENFISLAGYLGGLEETGTENWPGTKMNLEELTKSEIQGAIEDQVDLTQDEEYFKKGFNDLTQQLERVKIPDSIGQILVLSPEDPAIASPAKKLESGEIAYYNYPGHTRKTLYIEDYTHEKKFHSLPNLRPETLMRLIKMKVSSKGPHSVEVHQKEPK